MFIFLSASNQGSYYGIGFSISCALQTNTANSGILHKPRFRFLAVTYDLLSNIHYLQNVTRQAVVIPAGATPTCIRAAVGRKNIASSIQSVKLRYVMPAVQRANTTPSKSAPASSHRQNTKQIILFSIMFVPL